MDCERPPAAEPLPKLVEDELAGKSMSSASAGFVNLEAAGPASMTSSSTSDGNRRAPVAFQQTASGWVPSLLDNSTPLIDSTRTSSAPLTSRIAMRNMSGNPRRQMEDVELVQLADQVSTLATYKLLPTEPASGGDWERQHTAPLLAENDKIVGKGAGLRSSNVPAQEPALDALRERRPVRSLSLPLRPRLHVRFQDAGSECYTFGAAGEVISHFSPHAQPRHSCLMASPGEQGASQHDGPDGEEEEKQEEEEEEEEAEGDDEAEEGPRAKLRRLASLNGGSGSWQLKRAQLLGSLTGSPRGNPADTLK